VETLLSIIGTKWGEGRIARLEENGARTPLVIEYHDQLMTAGARNLAMIAMVPPRSPNPNPSQGSHENVETASDWATPRERAQNLTIPRARRRKNVNI
jgi:hypothetical protein